MQEVFQKLFDHDLWIVRVVFQRKVKGSAPGHSSMRMLAHECIYVGAYLQIYLAYATRVLACLPCMVLARSPKKCFRVYLPVRVCTLRAVVVQVRKDGRSSGFA
jgi:hypothetical protein